MTINGVKRLMVVVLMTGIAGWLGTALAEDDNAPLFNAQLAQMDTAPGVRGEKQVGDKIRAEVTRGGFANSSQ